MCLLVPGVNGDVLGYKCTCAYLHQLNSDGRTCSAVQSFILYAQQDEVSSNELLLCSLILCFWDGMKSLANKIMLI